VCGPGEGGGGDACEGEIADLMLSAYTFVLPELWKFDLLPTRKMLENLFSVSRSQSLDRKTYEYLFNEHSVDAHIPLKVNLLRNVS